MVTAFVERRFYSSDTTEKSEIYALMLSIVEVPSAFSSMIALRIDTDCVELESVCWDAKELKFHCRAKASFLEAYIDFVNLDEQIECLKVQGWKLLGKFDNEFFTGNSNTNGKDTENIIKSEILALSEFAKIELRRRLDDASILGKLIVDELRALDVSDKQYRIKVNDSKSINKFGIGVLILFGLIDFIFPDWFKDKSVFIFLLFGLSLLNFLYNEIVCRELSKEVQKHRLAYEDTCYRWSITTGVSWSNVALAAELATHNHSYPFVLEEEHASPSEIDEHWVVVSRSILRIVKNRYALTRYDSW
jgi:hypothetical protein